MARLADLAKDEIVVGGCIVLIAYVSLATYSVICLKTPFTPGDFGMGAAAILGSIGGGQGIRDWLEGKGDSYDRIFPDIRGGSNAVAPNSQADPSRLPTLG